MACVVSISFSMPLCARKFSIQKLQLRGVPLAGLSSQATIRTGYEARYRDPVVGVHGNSTHENNSMSRKPSLYSTALILLVLELAGFHIQFIKKTIVLCLIGIVLVGMF